MKENAITEIYNSHPLVSELLEMIGKTDTSRARIEGLTGSAKALVAASVFRKTQNTHLVILPEKETAAYFYNDLVSILGDEMVFFFP
jgi:transcription-repair coupling factor (superfamily II helicase)